MTKQIIKIFACLIFIGWTCNQSSFGAEPIVVGRTLDLSAALRSYGEAKRDGADAFITKLNAAGGIGGRPIELVTLDDKYSPSLTVENLRKIAKENRPVAFLGLFGVPTVAAALPVLAELKIPTVGLTSGTNAVRQPFNRYAFPVRASYADEASKLVGHFKSTGISKISIVYMDNPFGESLKNALILALKDSGMSAAEFKIDIAGKTSPSVVPAAVANTPQALFIATTAQVAVPLFDELKKTTYRGATYGFSTLDASTVTKLLGPKAVGLGLSQVFPIPQGIRLKIVDEYIQAIKALGRGAPNFYGLEGFIEAKVLAEGLKKAGRNPTPEALVKALETLRDLDIGGYNVTYTPEVHRGSSFVEVDVINSKGEISR